MTTDQLATVVRSTLVAVMYVGSIAIAYCYGRADAYGDVADRLRRRDEDRARRMSGGKSRSRNEIGNESGNGSGNKGTQ